MKDGCVQTKSLSVCQSCLGSVHCIQQAQRYECTMVENKSKAHKCWEWKTDCNDDWCTETYCTWWFSTLPLFNDISSHVLFLILCTYNSLECVETWSDYYYSIQELIHFHCKKHFSKLKKRFCKKEKGSLYIYEFFSVSTDLRSFYYWFKSN